MRLCVLLQNANDCPFFFVNLCVLCAFVVQKILTTKTQGAQRRHKGEKGNYCRAAVYFTITSGHFAEEREA